MSSIQYSMQVNDADTIATGPGVQPSALAHLKCIAALHNTCNFTVLARTVLTVDTQANKCYLIILQ